MLFQKFLLFCNKGCNCIFDTIRRTGTHFRHWGKEMKQKYLCLLLFFRTDLITAWQQAPENGSVYLGVQWQIIFFKVIFWTFCECRKVMILRKRLRGPHLRDIAALDWNLSDYFSRRWGDLWAASHTCTLADKNYRKMYGKLKARPDAFHHSYIWLMQSLT